MEARVCCSWLTVGTKGDGGAYNVVSRNGNFVLMPQNPTFSFRT